MQKRSEAFTAALLSLSWAVILSLSFLLIGWGLGLILAFSAGLHTAGAIISFDPNLRIPLWENLDDAKVQMIWGLSHSDVVKLADNEVHLNDGLFEALLIPFPPDLLALNQILNALRTRHYDDPSLRFLRASRFVFEGAPHLKWTLDGEEAEGASVTEIRNIHNAVTIRR